MCYRVLSGLALDCELFCIRLACDTGGGTLDGVSPSRTFAVWLEREIGLKSLSMIWGGHCLGSGQTEKLSIRLGRYPSRSVVLYRSASTGRG